MMSDDSGQKRVLQIMTVEFLRPGYILASRTSGELYLYQIPPGSEPQQCAETVSSAVADLLAKPDTLRIFISHEDCAIANEFFPDLFNKTA